MLYQLFLLESVFSLNMYCVGDEIKSTRSKLEYGNVIVNRRNKIFCKISLQITKTEQMSLVFEK